MQDGAGRLWTAAKGERGWYREADRITKEKH